MLRGAVRRWAPIAALALLVAGCGTGTPHPDPGSTTPAEPRTIRVPADAPTIAEAMDRVNPGDMVLLAPGTYTESVTISTPDVTLRGEQRNDVVIDGEGLRMYGVFASADGVRVENLTVRSHLAYGVLITGMHDESGPLAHGGPGYTTLDPADFPPLHRFAVDHVTASNNGLYGIYAFNARNGAITGSYASGSADSGFYVGQCEQCGILVRGNVAERNAIGFENANASDSLVIMGNRFSGNRVGMTLISNYAEAFTPQRANLVMGNLVSDNTSADSPSHPHGAFGIGIGVAGGQDNRFLANRVTGHPVAGVHLANTEDLAATGNSFVDTVFEGNGVDVGDASADRAPSSANCFDPAPGTTTPDALREAICPEGTTATPSQSSDWDSWDDPPGVSFLQVPFGLPQPTLEDVESIPDPLPQTLALPGPSEATAPSPELFQDLSGTA